MRKICMSLPVWTEPATENGAMVRTKLKATGGLKPTGKHISLADLLPPNGQSRRLLPRSLAGVGQPEASKPVSRRFSQLLFWSSSFETASRGEPFWNRHHPRNIQKARVSRCRYRFAHGSPPASDRVTENCAVISYQFPKLPRRTQTRPLGGDIRRTHTKELDFGQVWCRRNPVCYTFHLVRDGTALRPR